MIPVSVANCFSKEKLDFGVIATIKKRRRLTNLTNLTIVCYYCSSCLDLPVTLVDCQVEGCPSRLHHICQGEYVDMNEIDLDGGEQKICRNCVDEIQGQGKSKTLKKVVDSTVYRKDESQDNE